MEMDMSSIEIRRIMEGKMGNDFHAAFEGYVDGQLVAYHQRRWLVIAIVDAIVAGHIEATGDTVLRYAKWAVHHDRANYDRMPDNI
jgi:hypothetical protein